MHRFFLHPGDPADLAIARILVFLVIAIRFSVEPFLLGDLPESVMRMPIGMGWARDWIPREPSAVTALAWFVRIAAMAAALGLFTRVSTVAAAISTGLFFVIPNMYGHVGHDRHHLVWFAAILAASPCGDRWSVDAWLRRTAPAQAPAVRYGFPVRTMWLTMAVAYFFAGFWKLAGVGVDWFWSDNLRFLAAKLAYAGVGGHADLLVGSAVLTRLAGLGVVLFEMGFIGLVWFRSGRLVALAAAIVFHVGTYYLLGISFGHLLLCYPALFGIAGWWHARRRPFNGASIVAVRPPVVQMVMAAIVLGGNMMFGALQIGNGWPFASYPRFDVLHGPTVTSYVIEAEDATGQVVRLHDAELGGPVFGRHFYNLFRANQARVAGIEAPDGREPRWRALCTFVWARHPQLRTAVGARFLLEDLDISAGAGNAIRLGERPMFACTQSGPPPNLEGILR